jgi:protein TonB
MTPQSACLPVPASPETRRLLAGLALSFAAHLAVVLFVQFSPASLVYRAPQPLLVELRQIDAPPQPTAELAVPQAPSELAADPVAIVPPDIRPPEPPLRTPAPEQAAARPELPLDRYFTSGELDARAEPINEVDLVYPVRAYQMRVKGRVVLRMYINERGGLDEVVVVEAAPPGFFEEAALNAALALRFRPAVKNGRDVKSQKTIEVLFDPYERINTP